MNYFAIKIAFLLIKQPFDTKKVSRKLLTAVRGIVCVHYSVQMNLAKRCTFDVRYNVREVRGWGR